MDAEFWHRKWTNNDIGFHESAANPLLVKHLPALALEKGCRLFLPLCGKTLDIRWLLSHGYRVVGAELSRLAVEQLFAELGVEPSVSSCGPLERFSANDLEIFVGDIFDLSAPLLGQVDAVYDRAALVALPRATRGRYAAYVAEITARAPQLLICFEYDQSQMDGPPFSISGDEVAQRYGATYDVTLLERVDVPGRFKGKVAAVESAWLLDR